MTKLLFGYNLEKVVITFPLFMLQFFSWVTHFKMFSRCLSNNKKLYV